MAKYSKEKNVQMLISLMKKHKIHKIVASPGMKNLPFIASVQFDDFFKVYSCVDERSAAYMAGGLSVESGEPVALSCTGATASRNYVPGLTEAYYRHIPILAITSMSYTGEIGHMIPQDIDRSVQMNDLVNKSVEIQPIFSDKDAWSVNVKINDALLALRRGVGGPVHINLICENYDEFTENLLNARKIDRISYEDEFPNLNNKRVAIFVGNHKTWTDRLTKLVDAFCEKYNSAVVCDKTSNFQGKYRTFGSLLGQQQLAHSKLFDVDILIHIGDVSGAYFGFRVNEVWRVSPDGEIRDTFKKLRYIFEMSEEHFFQQYSAEAVTSRKTSYYEQWKEETAYVLSRIPELPFSNAWIAQNTEPRLPPNSILHLGILNSLRHWNFFNITEGVTCYSNTGGFGIDGVLSTAIGTALAARSKIVYVIIGDLAFFYDMNSLGNRHVPNNMRILLINNGMGIEFRNYAHKCAVFEEEANPYMAAAGHFGNKSPNLIKHYAEDLGFDYIPVRSKDDYIQNLDRILSDKIADKPLLIECFTNVEDESCALKILSNLIHTQSAQIKRAVKNVIGEKGVQTIKKIIK